jgi:hypothetical protein
VCQAEDRQFRRSASGGAKNNSNSNKLQKDNLVHLLLLALLYHSNIVSSLLF